jgi:hypothetical protein
VRVDLASACFIVRLDRIDAGKADATEPFGCLPLQKKTRAASADTVIGSLRQTPNNRSFEMSFMLGTLRRYGSQD